MVEQQGTGHDEWNATKQCLDKGVNKRSTASHIGNQMVLIDFHSAHNDLGMTVAISLYNDTCAKQMVHVQNRRCMCKKTTHVQNRQCVCKTDNACTKQAFGLATDG